ncbi:DUF1294 domain-containing protein [Caproicibacter fermentans]|nr:DUF1294 domain-containing protein [Caproicibacter fermentans]
MPGYIYLICYAIIINLMAAISTVVDKHRAARHRWRIPESRLLFFAAVGGSPAMLFTMLLIRHKTRHAKFMIGIPVILLAQCVVLYFGLQLFQ